MIYGALAPLYDRLMSHVDYGQWLDLIVEVVNKFLKTRKLSILELGGGTGSLGRKLLRQGYVYTGTDISPAMCAQVPKKGHTAICADGRAIPFKKQFDMVIFLYDGINYLPSISDYTKLFSEVSNNLIPGGLFLFDITTERNSLENFTDYMDFEELQEASFVRHSWYDKASRQQYNDFTIFARTGTHGLYTRQSERHCQKVFPFEELAAAVPPDLFEILGIWDNFSFKRANARSERIHFLLRKVSL
jgi:SAM-dependent methyltransferase